MLLFSLSESGLARSFIASLIVHLIIIVLSVVVAYRSSLSAPIVVPPIDLDVPVIFSPFGGQLPSNNGYKKSNRSTSNRPKLDSVPLKTKKESKSIRGPEKKSKKPNKLPKELPKKIAKKAAAVKAESKVVAEQKVASKKNRAIEHLSKSAEQSSVEQSSLPEHIVVGRAAYEEYRIASEIRRSLEHVFVVPCGMDESTRCILVITIDARGIVTHIDTKTSSGSALYDSAARYAASKIAYPREVWNRVLVLEFEGSRYGTSS